jgi:hypothetical protein
MRHFVANPIALRREPIALPHKLQCPLGIKLRQIKRAARPLGQKRGFFGIRSIASFCPCGDRFWSTLISRHARKRSGMSQRCQKRKSGVISITSPRRLKPSTEQTLFPQTFSGNASQMLATPNPFHVDHRQQRPLTDPATSRASPTKISAGAGGGPTKGDGVRGDSGLIAPVSRAVAACSPDTGSNQRDRRSFLLRSARCSLSPNHRT